MKIVVFGSTGGTGAAIVSTAIERGHDVKAFGRSAEKLANLKGQKITTYIGDVLDTATVSDAILGLDAVVCALGASATDKSKIRAKGTQNIIDAMQKHNVRRLICISALGCGDSRRFLPFQYKYIFIPFFLKNVYSDHEEQEGYIRSSGLDWTIVRPAVLTDTDCDKGVWHGIEVDAPVTWKIGRKAVAEFMLDELERNAYMHAAPCLSCAR
jgi:uncharacterized protein YbjT (DUF2867 family)